jgi:hypothetical protein
MMSSSRMPAWSSMNVPKTWSLNSRRMSVSRSNDAAPFSSPRSWAAFMLMSKRDAQNRCLSMTCSARSRK